MADTLKIPKDKRHRSSSSIAASNVEDTRSERKLNIKACIPEVDDQFAIAEARCEDLMEKIDLFKSLKRKKKLKKRSMTLVTDQATTSTSNNPFIAVRALPKKKLSQLPRLRRIDIPKPGRGYVDPAAEEQHRMLGPFRQKQTRLQRDVKRMQGMQKQEQLVQEQRKTYRSDYRSSRADGDAIYVQNYEMESPIDATYEDDDLIDYSSDEDQQDDAYKMPSNIKAGTGTVQKQCLVIKQKGKRKDRTVDQTDREKLQQSQQKLTNSTQKKSVDMHQMKLMTGQRRKDNASKGPESKQKPIQNNAIMTRSSEKLRMQAQAINRLDTKRSEDRGAVVELFNKQRHVPAPESHTPRPPRSHRMKRVPESVNECDLVTGPLGDVSDTRKTKDCSRQPRRYKHRTRSYELPTVSSQMKQAGTRYYYETPNHSKLPFIVSKSTSPSHNIGVNLQQVLNGVKMQQPVSGIPLTIAHHMGLRHVPTFGVKSAPMAPVLSTREINVIKAGPRLVRLPSFKYLSYKRLLSLYREGEGMVPRFLRSISRPHYFYTSMYNLQMNREEDGATSKGRASISHEAKQHLSEYAAIYKEFEHIDKCLKENYEPDLQRRKEELTKELLAREEQIRKVVTEYGSPDVEIPNLRASASIAEDTYRHSPSKMLNKDS